MSTALSDHQFELLPTLGASSGVTFGIGADSLIELADGGFIPGDDDWTNEDTPNPRQGGTRFGRDALNGPTHGFNLYVNADDEAGALDALSAFKSAWRALAMRDTPGLVLPVRYQLNGRVRRFYGRPGRFAAPVDNQILSGYVPITTDFRCVDGFTYDDVQQSEIIAINVYGSSQGGFIFPVTFPTSTLPVGDRTAQAVVGGDAPARPVIRFDGPVNNPSLSTEAWTLSLGIDIPAGQYVTVDLQPWAGTVLLNGRVSVAGALGIDRRQYLADMTLEPGRTDLTFRGASSSSSATCTVSWRNTWNSI